MRILIDSKTKTVSVNIGNETIDDFEFAGKAMDNIFNDMSKMLRGSVQIGTKSIPLNK